MSRGTEQAPLWQVDLRPFGCQGYKAPREALRYSGVKAVRFSSKDVIIASFLAHEAAATLPHRNEPNANLPLKLRAVFLNAATGSPKATMDWPAPHAAGVSLLGTHGGQFVVVTGGRLTLYSPDLELLKELRVATPPGLEGDAERVEVSPQGGSLLLVFLWDRYPNEWVDADDLHIVRSWREPLGFYSISDDELAIYRDSYIKPRGFLSEVVLRGRDGGSHTICRSWTGCGTPKFISNEVLALCGPHGFSLVRTDGEELFAEDFTYDDWVGMDSRAASFNGRRFAVTFWAQRGGSALLDTNFHNVLKRIMVFDIPSRQWVYTLDAKKQKIKTISGLALSPDGSLMAIMTNGTVEVYRLPPSPPGQEPAPQP